MNGNFEDDDHFNFDMVMNEQHYNTNKQDKEETKNDIKIKKEIPISSLLKLKKNRKLALKKRSDISKF